MKYEFSYSDIIAQSKMLSAYEGRDYITGSNEHGFLEMVLTEQEIPLLHVYINEAARIIEKRISRMVVDSAYDVETKDCFYWDLRTEETRWNSKRSIIENVRDAIASYIIYKWMMEKKGEKSTTYLAVWNDMLEQIVVWVFKKEAPTKRNKRRCCSQWTDTSTHISIVAE